jgi:hypothetical protein
LNLFKSRIAAPPALVKKNVERVQMLESDMHIRVNQRDNVAVVVSPENGIPAGQKVALSAIPSGAPITRYGQTIGHATRSLDAGVWVREEHIAMPEAPPLDGLHFDGAAPLPREHVARDKEFMSRARPGA